VNLRKKRRERIQKAQKKEEKMSKVNVYSEKGTKLKASNFPRSYTAKLSMRLLAQAIRVYEARLHPGLAKTKRRGEVVASKRKIYRQKGTGRARHGAKSAPIFVGGGVTHGPDGNKRTLSLPRKMKSKALSMALTLKVDENEVVFVNKLSTLKKTKDAAKLINKILKSQSKKLERVTLYLSGGKEAVRRAFKNLENVKVYSFKNINAYDVYFGGLIILDNDVFKPKKKVKKKSKSKDSKTKK
jgi:large subunit ribosomal protein L4